VSLYRYSLIVLAVVLGSLALAWPALGRLGESGRAAALLGGMLAATNALLAYALVLATERRTPKAFMATVLGGMLGRMAAMLAAVVAAVQWLGVPKVPLAVSLLSYFAIFLAFEIAILQRKTTSEMQPR
jgi:hypothetical protein